MKLTKNCLYPWYFLQVHAGGMMQCCAVGNDCDMGDFIIDYCQKQARGEPADVLNSPAIVRLRESLLTGNLRPMCRQCFFVDNRLVTTDQLKERLKEYLSKRLPAGSNIDEMDLARTYAYDDMALSLTNRCNLNCVYCIQSTMAKTNPYFKMDFPSEYTEATLDFFASQGITYLRTCVEGEATFHKDWYSIISAFKGKYPGIKLRMTTNLSRKYTDREIDLLARYHVVDVSCDTLDPELYAKLRRGGNLALILDNIKKIQARVAELGIHGPVLSLHAVVSDVTLPTLESFVDYAFANGMIPVLGNYEERTNSLAYREKICRPIAVLPREEQIKAQRLLIRTKERIESLNQGYNMSEIIQGDLIYNMERRAERDYNRFKPYDDNPLHKAFHACYPRGREDMHLSIAYDYDNTAYAGILFSRPGTVLQLDGFEMKHLVAREVSIYRHGASSTKYGQTVLPGYRKTITVKSGKFEYTPSFAGGVKQVLLEVSDFW